VSSTNEKEESMYVYLIQSHSDPRRRYVGLTHDLARRVAEHNSQECLSTRAHIPWRLVVALWFNDGLKARRFERYLKGGSGRAFSLRHFWHGSESDGGGGSTGVILRRSGA